jgi:iron transport multicopper oxidase
MPSYAAPPTLRLAPPAETNLLAARPVPAERAPDATQSMYLEVVFDADASGVNRAYINGATHPGPSPVALAVPLLHTYVTREGGPLSVPETLTGTLEGSATTPFLLPAGRVIQVMINNTDGGEHPFHLHGHNFWVVATSEAPEAAALYAANYVRRDVVSVPAQGWAVIRFVADNPGIWSMHCHIEWHMAAGLMTTFIEAPAMMRVLATTGDMRIPAGHAANCRNYAASVM